MVTLRNPLVDSTEGYEEDLDPSVDAIAAAGFFPQNTTSNDMLAGVTRDAGGNLVLTDAVLGASRTLSQLAAGASGFTEAKLLLAYDGTLVYVGDGEPLRTV